MCNIGIAIGTFGDFAYARKACDLAYKLYEHLYVPVATYHHDDSLAIARNEAAAKLEDVDYLIFVDTDDNLDHNYIDAMYQAICGEGILYKPSTIGMYPDGSFDDTATMIKQKDMYEGNSLILGTMMSKTLFQKVGGFNPDLPALEDWDLFLKLISYTGCKIKEVPDAIYQVGVNDTGRNSDKKAHMEAYKKIRNSYMPFRKKMKDYLYE